MGADTAVLQLVATAPLGFIGGITVAVIGSKQKTSAQQYAADVTIACEHIRTAIELLPNTAEGVTELSSALERLVERGNEALDALDALKALSFDPDLHGSEFLKSLQLVRAIREVVNTPVLDD
jgi:hypothetical protein